MAIIVMILGESGTGKSASLRKFVKEELAVVNVIGKPLPFRSHDFETLNSDDYGTIWQFVSKTDKKSIVIDDAQYLMANEFMRRAKEKGYEKFTEIGQNYWSLVNRCAQKLPADTIVYFLQHVETGSDGSTVKAKTIGKMLDEKVTLEGMFSIVLRTTVNDGEYCFSTQNNGSDTVKSPVGMFDSDLIPNDLKMVDDHIRRYYDLETAALMESGGFADAVAERAETSLKEQEEHHKELLDINAPHIGIVDDETPLKGKTLVDDLKELCQNRGIKQSEVMKFVAKNGQYAESVPIDAYEDDFLEYLIANFNKLAISIEKRRN